LKNTRNLFLLFTFLLPSCGQQNDSQKANTLTLEEKCVEKLKNVLKNPNSYESIEWKYAENDVPDWIHLKEGENSSLGYKFKVYNRVLIHTYRVKNIFGGWHADKIYFLLDSTDAIEMSESLPDFLSLKFK
jgi:hypothetical protein